MAQDDAEAWHDRARRLTDRVTDLRTARRWSEESYRFNPGHRLRRSAPLPPAADWDYTWDRITNHLEAITRTLAETAAKQPDGEVLPGPAPGIVAALLRAAGDVCGLDDTLECSDSSGQDGDEQALRRTRDRREALRRAYAAENELTSVFREGGDALRDALAAVTADTIRLLGDARRSRDATRTRGRTRGRVRQWRTRRVSVVRGPRRDGHAAEPGPESGDRHRRTAGNVPSRTPYATPEVWPRAPQVSAPPGPRSSGSRHAACRCLSRASMSCSRVIVERPSIPSAVAFLYSSALFMACGSCPLCEA